MDSAALMPLDPVMPPAVASRLRLDAAASLTADSYAATVGEAMGKTMVEALVNLRPPADWREMECMLRVWDTMHGFTHRRVIAGKIQVAQAAAQAAAAAPDSGLVNVTPTVRRAAPVDVSPEPEPPAFD